MGMSIESRIGSRPLSQRELQILGLVERGMTNQGIAGQLGITVNTVRAHLGNTFRKLGVETRTAAVYVARSQRDGADASAPKGGPGGRISPSGLS